MQYVTYRNCMYTLKGNTSMANFKITFDHILKAFIKTINNKLYDNNWRSK